MPYRSVSKVLWRTIPLMVLLAIVSQLGIAASVQAQQYSTPVTSGPSVSIVPYENGKYATVTITWGTSSGPTSPPGLDRVSYRTAPATQYSNVDVDNPPSATSHTVVLTFLLPDRTYDYFVWSSWGATSASASGAFTTTFETQTPTLTITSGPSVTLLSASSQTSSATIEWITDLAASSDAVLYGTAPDLGSRVDSTHTIGATAHAVTLSGLMPNTKYYYKAQSGTVSSAIDSFITPTTSAPPGAPIAFYADDAFYSSGGTGVHPIFVAADNLIGSDSIPDLVIVNRDANSIRILKGLGRGVFDSTDPANRVDLIGVGLNKPRMVLIVDLNGDGKKDLVIPNAGNSDLDHVTILQNYGGGLFEPSSPIANVGHTLMAVAAADIVGSDGKPDLIIASSDDENIVVYQNVSYSGPFGSISFVRVGPFQSWDAAGNIEKGYGPRALAIGNLDSTTSAPNSIPDIVLANDGGGISSGGITVFLSNPGFSKSTLGTALIGQTPYSVHTFAAPNNPPMSPIVGPTCIRIADVDGDGDKDIIAANFTSNNVTIYKNPGTGGFSGAADSAVTYPLPTETLKLQGPQNLDVGDFDGDLDIDIAIANARGHSVVVLENNGLGTFSTKLVDPREQVPNTPVGIIVTDLDGDTDLDLVTANFAGDNISVLVNTRLNPSLNIVLGPAVTSMSLAPGATVASASIEWSTDAPAFSDTVKFGTTKTLGVHVDSTRRASVTAHVVVLGDLSLGTKYYFSVSSRDSSGNVVAAAIDSFVTPSPPMAGVPITFFEDDQFYSAGGAGSRPVFVGVDTVMGNDKIPDLIIVNRDSSTVRILKGLGGGLFDDTNPFNRIQIGGASDPMIGLNRPRMALSVDLNRDGKKDLVIPNSGNPGGDDVVILQNYGSEFVRTAITGAGRSLSAVAAADIDGDGDPDLFVASHDDNAVSLYQNNSSGTMVGPFVLLGKVNSWAGSDNVSKGYGPRALAIGDLNGDGSPDFAVANDGSGLTAGGVTVFLSGSNQGFETHGVAAFDGGSYAVQTFIAPNNPPATPVVGPACIKIADFDKDGSNDIVVGNFTSDNVTVYRNPGGTTTKGNFAAFLPMPVTYPFQSEGVTLGGPAGIDVGDFDNDNDIDVAVASSLGHSIAILDNNGSGVFATRPVDQKELVSNTPVGIVAADVDRDSDIDLVTANVAGDNVSVLLNTIVGPALRFLLGPTVTDTTLTSATFEWVTDLPADSAQVTIDGGGKSWTLSIPRSAIDGGRTDTLTVGGLTALTLYTTTIRAFAGATPAVFSKTFAIQPTFTISAPQTTIKVGESVTFSGAASVGGRTTRSGFLWFSSGPGAAVDLTSGRVTGISAGTATITAVHQASGLKASGQVTVESAGLLSIALTVSPSPATVMAGRSVNLIASVSGTYTDGTRPATGFVVVWESLQSSIATVMPAQGDTVTVNGVAAGTTTIRATASLSGKTATKDVTVSVSRPQVDSLRVTIQPQSVSVPVGGRARLSASTRVFRSDGSSVDTTMSVAWQSTNPSAASVSPAQGDTTNVLGFVRGAQPVIVTATATLDEKTSSAAQAQVTVTGVVVDSLKLHVSPPGLSILVGRTARLTARATIYRSDGSSQDTTGVVSWGSLAPGVATVSPARADSATVTGLAPGAAVVRVSAEAAGKGAVVDVPVSVSLVGIDSVRVAVKPGSVLLPEGRSAELVASTVIFRSDGSSRDTTGVVTWDNSDRTALSVVPAIGDAVRIVAFAAATSPVNVKATASVGGVTGSFTVPVTVSFAVVDSLRVTVEPPAVSVPVGKSAPLRVSVLGIYSSITVSPAGAVRPVKASVIWTSADSLIARASPASGDSTVVGGVRIGRTTVRAVANFEAEASASGEAAVNVGAPVVDSLQVVPLTISLAAGEQRQVSVFAFLSDGSKTDITSAATWRSLTTSVVAVGDSVASLKGMLTGRRAGSGTVTATYTYRDLALTAQAKITVTQAALVRMEIDPALASIAIGDSVQFLAYRVRSDSTRLVATGGVRWTVVPSSVASINGKGFARGVGEGTAAVVATDSVTGTSGKAVVQVRREELLVIQVQPADTTVGVGDAIALRARGLFTTGTAADITAGVVWSSSDSTILRVLRGGDGLALREGTVTVTIVDAVGKALRGTGTVTVRPAALVAILVSPEAPMVGRGGSVQFEATGTYRDKSERDITTQVRWSTDPPGIVSITTGGLASAITAGGTSVIAELEGVRSLPQSVTVDVEPPKFAVRPVAVVVSDSMAIYKWLAGEPHRAVVALTRAGGGTEVRLSLDSLQTTQIAELRGLDPSTDYTVSIVMTDRFGNQAPAFTETFRTASVKDLTPPWFVTPPLATAVRDSLATVAFGTSELTTATLLVYSSGDTLRVQSATAEKIHLVTVRGLTPLTPYGFTVRATDLVGNGPTEAFGGFTTTAGSDVTPPTITSPTTPVKVGENSATLQNVTDEPTTMEVAYGPTENLGNVKVDPQTGTLHSVELTDLKPNTLYFFRARVTDLAGLSTLGKLREFRTRALPDTTRPNIVEGPVSKGVTESSAVIFYKTDELSTTGMDFGTSPDQLSGRVRTAELTIEHVVTLVGAPAGTEYFYRVLSSDGAGNTVISDVRRFRTTTRPILPVIEKGPVVEFVTENTVGIGWSTNVPSSTIAMVLQGGSVVTGQALPELATSHSLVVTNLQAGTVYGYQVRSVDMLGNAVESGVIEFRTRPAADITAPSLTSGPLVTPRETEAVIQWTASEPASYVLRYGTARDALFYSAGNQMPMLAQRAFLGGLTPGTVYYYSLELTDVSTNTSRTRSMSFTTPRIRDIFPPYLSGVGLGYRSNRNAVISWMTDKLSSGHVFFRMPGSPFYEEIADETMGTRHTLILSGLIPGFGYQFIVASQDAYGNLGILPRGTPPGTIGLKRLREMAASGELAALQPPGGDFAFETLPEADLVAPVIVQAPQVIGRSASTLTLQWSTDETSSSEVKFAPVGGAISGKRVGAMQATGDIQVKQVSDLVTTHTVTLTGLEAGASYEYTVGSTDPSGNPVESADPSVASTLAEQDATPPAISDVSARSITDKQANIFWTTNELSNSVVSYGAEIARGATGDTLIALGVRQDGEVVTSHSITLTNLEPGTTYYYQVSSSDLTQNTTSGTIRSLTTEALADTRPPVITAGPSVAGQTVSEGLLTAVIEWTTDEESNSFVDYGTGPERGTKVGTGELVTVHSVSLTRLAPGRPIFFLAGSEDAVGNMVLAEVASFTPAVDLEPPAVPSGFTATAGNREILLAWNPSPDPDLAVYRVDRTVGGVRTLLSTGLADTTYRDTGLANDLEVTYQLVAVDRAGNLSLSTMASATATAGDAPTAPVISAAQLEGRGQGTATPNLVITNALASVSRPALPLTYTFSVYADEAMTQLEASATGIAEGWLRIEAGVDTNQTVWHVSPPLENGKTYWWRARANDGLFNGPWSAESSFTINATGVAAVELSSFTGRSEDESAVIEWQTLSDAGYTGFQVYRGATEDGDYTRISDGAIVGGPAYRWVDRQVVPGMTYFYKLESMELAGAGRFYGPVSVTVDVPKEFALSANAPNPFNPTTLIRYQVPGRAMVNLRVFNAAGQVVATLVNGEIAAGRYTAAWDGRDESGKELASGLYFYRLEAGRFVETRKMLMLK